LGLKFCATYPYFYPDLNRPYYEVVDECVEIAQAAEDLGFESISLPEHHFFNYICNPSALQFATLIAAKTKRIKILTGVLVLPYYHPLALAEEIALVDHITRGRIEVGVARGANKYEFDRLGIDWNNSRAMYEESLTILKRAWTEADLQYHGQFWSFPAVTAIPRPYQKPYPKLWTSAQSLSGVRAVAEKGLNMMTSPNLGCFAPHGDLERVMDEFNRTVASSAKPRGDVMVLRRVFVDETEERALQKLDNVYFHWRYYMSQFRPHASNARTEVQQRLSEREENTEIVVRAGSIRPADVEIDRTDVYNTYDDPIITGPDRAIQRFKHYESLGVTHIMGLTAFGIPVNEVIRSMEVLSRYVTPAFQDRTESAAKKEVAVGV
jgi:flavin-dependent trigonelline monooxygenase, oxygenase component